MAERKSSDSPKRKGVNLPRLVSEDLLRALALARQKRMELTDGELITAALIETRYTQAVH